MGMSSSVKFYAASMGRSYGRVAEEHRGQGPLQRRGKPMVGDRRGESSRLEAAPTNTSHEALPRWPLE